MIRGLIGTGLAGLGLVGGAAAIHYADNGTATVKVKDHGVTRTVQLGGGGGPLYSCPADIDSKLKPVDIRSARIKLTLRDVRAEENQLDAQYPKHYVPQPILDQFNSLADRDDALVAAFNNTIAQHNQILQSDCTKES